MTLDGNNNDLFDVGDSRSIEGKVDFLQRQNIALKKKVKQVELDNRNLRKELFKLVHKGKKS